jgi:hypothetical protein
VCDPTSISNRRGNGHVSFTVLDNSRLDEVVRIAKRMVVNIRASE